MRIKFICSERFHFFSAIVRPWGILLTVAYVATIGLGSWAVAIPSITGLRTSDAQTALLWALVISTFCAVETFWLLLRPRGRVSRQLTIVR